MNINELVEKATAQAAASGFTDLRHPRSVEMHTALIVTEVGELFEAHRDGYAPAGSYYENPYRESYSTPTDEEGNILKPVGIASELADIVIRVANMAGEYGIDLTRAIEEKMAYNATRPLMHGRQV